MAAIRNSSIEIKAKKIGNLWICGHLNSDKPYVRIGIWDEDVEEVIDINQAMELRRLLTEIIIKSKQ